MFSDSPFFAKNWTFFILLTSKQFTRLTSITISFTMSSVASNQVIDVKAKKPRAPKKDKNEPSDSIPPPTNPALETTATAVTSASETKTKKPRATKKDKTVDTATSPTNDTNAIEAAAPADLDSETDAKTKKPRAPTLPAKFAKFIKFNFFFINQMNDIDQDTKDAYLNTFAVFAPVEQQTQIVTDFLLTQKSVNKDYRSALSAQKKAIAKANKPQRRSKKSVQVDFQNNLVNQLIESANNNDSQPSNDSAETKEKKPRGRKPKNTDSNDATTNDTKENDAKENSDSATKDVTPKETKEKKPRGRKPKQTETVTAPATPTSTPNVESATTDADAEDDEDTEVSRFVHGGKSFLRDRDNNLYDELSHEPVGEYDPNNDSVVLL